jgi:hypothetical protein
VLQKRNLKTNVAIALFPILVCVLLVLLQAVIDGNIDKAKHRCGCACVDTAADGSCRRSECGAQYSTLDQVRYCPIPSPPRWPALVPVPPPQSRAVRTASQPFDGLPEPTCRDKGSCPAVFLVTGSNRSLVESMPSIHATVGDSICMFFIFSRIHMFFIHNSFFKILLLFYGRSFG